MHLDTSISLATWVSWRVGGGKVSVAERRIRSPSPRFSTNAWVGGLLTAVRGLSDMLVPLRRRGRLDVHEERLELRRLGVCVAHERRERVRTEAFAGGAGEAPVQRDAHDVDDLAVALQRLDPLGHQGFRF